MDRGPVDNVHMPVGDGSKLPGYTNVLMPVLLLLRFLWRYDIERETRMPLTPKRTFESLPMFQALLILKMLHCYEPFSIIIHFFRGFAVFYLQNFGNTAGP
jgi:hypothetical protein